jgi:hypothetical protein
MSRSKVMLAVAFGAALLVAGLIPVWTAGESAVTEHAALAGTTAPAPEPLALEDDSVCEAGGLVLIKPYPGGCLGSQPLTCDDMPMPYGATCSCSSALLQQKCKNCDNKKKGLVLKTTCTVCPRCWNPPCDIQACNSRTSLTCSTF